MSDLPIVQMIVVPALAIGALVYLKTRQKRMMAEGEKMYANFRLADVSQRTGLAIIEGDPNFNLMMAYANHGAKDYEAKGGLAGQLMGEGKKETRALMRGAPNGRPTEFVYYYRTDLDTSLVGKTITHSFDCRLSMRTTRPFPPFQIVLRSPGPGMDPFEDEEWTLPPQSFADPVLDAKFILTGADPRLGPMLAPVLGPLLDMGFVQIRGWQQAVTSHTTMMASSVSLYALERMQLVLDQMAAVLEGTASPHLGQPPATLYMQRPVR